MRQLNPAWFRAVKEVTDACPYFGLQSMNLAGLTPGGSELAIDLGQKHLQPFGVVHGGVLATMVDAAGFWACYSLIDDGLGMTTVELKLNYLRPAGGSGRLTARGRAVHQGKGLGLGEASVHDAQGRLLAHGTTTVIVMPDMPLWGQDALPPKFL